MLETTTHNLQGFCWAQRLKETHTTSQHTVFVCFMLHFHAGNNIHYVQFGFIQLFASSLHRVQAAMLVHESQTQSCGQHKNAHFFRDWLKLGGGWSDRDFTVCSLVTENDWFGQPRQLMALFAGALYAGPLNNEIKSNFSKWGNVRKPLLSAFQWNIKY
jgi:hypothetical protein